MMQADVKSIWLPPERAFVVQFYAETEVDATHMSGRVEHVVSGQVSHFHSLASLLSFIHVVLTEGKQTDATEA
jgi:hypothetical protein